MPETIYYPEVRVMVTPGGLLPNGVTARIADVNNRPQFVQVTRGMINTRGEIAYLPVGIVEIDRRLRRALIELPTEADSGANRMWVSFDDLHHETHADAGTGALA
jgi:hypothetical protein